MPKRSTFSGDIADFPLHILRAAQADRSYYSQAACRSPIDTPMLAWTAEASKRYRLNPDTGAWETVGPTATRRQRSEAIQGKKLIALAAMVCKSCDVQHACARAAIEGGEPVGTWAAPIEDIRWLGSRPDWETVLDHAEAEGVNVQTAIRVVRSYA